MSGVYVLKSDVKIADLYKDLDSAKIKKIEKAAKDGFTLQELRTLEEDGIDTSLIKNNSTKGTAKKTTKTDKDVQTKAKEVKKKYCTNLAEYSGDKYKADNPELKALNEALSDSLIIDLGQEGYSKSQIIKIISIAFPNIGIELVGNDGKYTCPYGHGDEASKIYKRFTSHLLFATGEDGVTLQNKRNELAKLNAQIASNNHTMQILEVTIEALQKEVEEQINEAIEDSEDIQDENKKKAQNAVSTRLSEYKNSNGEMTYEEFQQNISGDLKGIQTKTGRALSDVVASIIDANRKMSLLKSYVAEMGELSSTNKELTTNANDVKDEIDTLIKEQAEKDKDDDDADKTDPIGFSTDSARFDFFVDKDNNSDISNTNEFLGAKDGFSEMKALDTDGDGIVTGAELDSANVMVVKTNKDGTQEIVKASSIFNATGDGIKLNSFKNANVDIGNGNTLLGTFSASVNGANMDGYQTLDTNDWLNDNYTFTDKIEGKGDYVQGDETVVESLDYSDKINIFTLTNTELEQKLNKAWTNIGITQEQTDSIISAEKAQSQAAGKKISNKFDEIAKTKEQEVTLDKDETLEKAKEAQEELDKLKEEDDKDKDKDKKD